MKNNYLAKHIIGTLVVFSFIFIAAGKIIYPQGLMYVSLGFIMFLLNYTILKPGDDLLNERSGPGKGVKPWDKKIVGLLGLLTITSYIVAGLDSGRYKLSPEFSDWVYCLGIILTIIGQLLFLIAQKQNKFFSSLVRIQKDRGHTIFDQGLYKIVRHPGYLGLVLQSIGLPLFFGSIWSAIPACMSIVLIFIRTSLEDSTLQVELLEYKDYVKNTKWRLIPYLW